MEFIVSDHFIQRLEERFLIEYSPEVEKMLIDLITNIEFEKSIMRIRNTIYHCVKIDNKPAFIVLAKLAYEQYELLTVIRQDENKSIHRVHNKFKSNEIGYRECIQNLNRAIDKYKFSYNDLKVNFQKLKDKINKASFLKRLKYLFSGKLQ